MHAQLGYTLTVWRWFIAMAGIATGAEMLRAGDAQRWVAFTFLLIGVGLVGLEVYLRRTRRTLVLNAGTVDVLSRGANIGSFPVEGLRHWDRASRVRVLIKALLVSFVCFFVFGALLFFSGDKLLGLGLLAVGVIFTLASVWEFKALWQIVLTRPMPIRVANGIETPGAAKPAVLTLATSQSVILLRKADVVQLLGFWPADAH